MLSKDDIDKSFMEVFNSMEEGVEYELTDEAFSKIRNLRKDYGYHDIKPFSFKKQNHCLIFDWKQNAWKSDKVGINGSVMAFAFSLSFAFSLAFSLSFAFALAFFENRIQKVEKSCDGKIVEIDGKKYKLTLTN